MFSRKRPFFDETYDRNDFKSVEAVLSLIGSFRSFCCALGEQSDVHDAVECIFVHFLALSRDFQIKDCRMSSNRLLRLRSPEFYFEICRKRVWVPDFASVLGRNFGRNRDGILGWVAVSGRRFE